MHNRIGNFVCHNKKLILDLIHQLVKWLKDGYLEGGHNHEKEKVVDVAVFILSSFLACLRGEETV